METKTTLCIDNGSESIKSGYCGEEIYTSNLLTVIGTIQTKNKEKMDYIIGETAISNGNLTLRYPIEKGVFTDLKDFEILYNHIFQNELAINPQEHSMILTESFSVPNKARSLIAEIMFETYQIPAIYFGIQGLMSLYASGRTTGTTVDAGEGISHTIPIYEGYPLIDAVYSFEISGKEVTDYFMKLINEKQDLFTIKDRVIVKHIKETLSIVQNDEKIQEFEKYELPNGDIISIGTERVKCTEVLFNPKLFNIEHGIHQLLDKSIQKTDKSVHKDLYQNIVLSGGSTLFEGYEKRLKYELDKLNQHGLEIQVISKPDRKSYNWLGGSILGSLTTFDQLATSKTEYEEMRPGQNFFMKKFNHHQSNF